MRLDASLPLGLSEGEIQRLVDADLDTVEDVAQADFERVAAVARIRLSRAEAAVERARSLVDEPRPADVHLERLSSGRLARGVLATRDLERTVELVRRCRRHLREAPASRERDRARKQLKRLRLVLEPIQRQVLAEGVTEAGHRRLTRTLSPLDEAMDACLGDRPRRGRMKALRWLARDTRRVIQLVALDALDEGGEE